MKIVSLASLMLPGAFAGFSEEAYRYDTSGGHCTDASYEAPGITSAAECQAAMSDEGTQGPVREIGFGDWFNGCFKNSHGLFYNTGFDQNQHGRAVGNAKGSGAQWLCKKKKAEALHRFDTSGGQCADPMYDVDGFTTAEECKQALGDEGTDTSKFQVISFGDWFNGCFKNSNGVFYNTGFDKNQQQRAVGNAKGSGAQWLCKHAGAKTNSCLVTNQFCKTAITSAAECKTAATEQGKTYRQPIGYFNSNGNPSSYGPGCVATGSNVYFNTATGSSRAATASKPFICKSCDTVPLKTSKYGVIKEKFCANPIDNAAECKTAATELGHVYRQPIGYFNSNGNPASYGPGCVITGSNVYFNTATGSSRAAAATKPFICKGTKTVEPKESVYGVIKEKFCEEPIFTAAQCKTAATELGHVYRQQIGYFNSNGNSASYGPGCVVTGSNVYFNTATGSSRAAHPHKPFICKGTETVPLKKSVYGVIKEKFCANPIDNAAECKSAATELGHIYRQPIGYFNSNGNPSSYGPGCVVTGTSVYFNTASGSSRAAHPHKPFICKGTKTVPLKLSVYGVIKSEFCKSPIFTAAECKIAAAELGKVYRQQIGYYNSNGNSASYGPGCVVSGTSVYFNTVQGSSRAAAANKPFICKGQDTVPLAKSAFAVIKSDFCANPIDDAAECKTAATALGKAYRQEISYFNSGSNPASYGPGCVVSGSSVYYNKATGSTRAAATNKPFICTGTETVGPKESVFGIIKSEFCETPVPNADECKNAAQELGYAYRTSSGYYNSNGNPGSYGPGCFVTGSNVYYNVATGSTRAATASRPLLCMGDKHAPLGEGAWLTTKEKFCAKPITSADDCKEAATEQGYAWRTSSRYNKGTYGPGCFVTGSNVYFNTNSESYASSVPLLCEGKTTEAPTMQPTVPPTDAPTTNPYPKQCNPYECDDWTCKTWCTCFTAHPEIIKIFEGENPSALDQSFRASCPSDNDECDCDDFVYDISGNQN